jgi:hypothetical protein
LKLESVAEQEVNDIRQAFLESMVETQAGLTEWETELIELLISLTNETGEAILTSQEIGNKLSFSDEFKTKRACQIWIGRTFGQLHLYSKREGKKNYKDENGNNRRGNAYLFTNEHLKNILYRYTVDVSIGHIGSIG